MVVFSATSLLNSFVKTGVNGDYFAALEVVSVSGNIDTVKIAEGEMPAALTNELEVNVGNAANDLNIGLGLALDKACVRVMVTDITGGEVIENANVSIFEPDPNGCTVDDNLNQPCSGVTDAVGQMLFT